MLNPIVFVPGSSSAKDWAEKWIEPDYFYAVGSWLTRLGYDTRTVQFPCFKTIAERAKVLEAFLFEHYEGQEVHLIAHSAGGLDTKYMLSQLSPRVKVLSLSTLMTPHRGAKLIDFWTDYAPKFVLDRIQKYCENRGGSLEYWLEYSPRRVLPLEETFNAIPSHVKRFSVTSEIPPKNPFHSFLLFWIPYFLIKKAEGPTDGFVSVQSAHFGELISHETADHFQLVGQPFGFTRGYDYFSVYRKIIHRLSRLEKKAAFPSGRA